MKRAQVSVFVILGLVILFSSAVALYMFSSVRASQSETVVSVALQESVLKSSGSCIDGSSLGFCSSTKPLLCDDGKLVFDCQSCGCLQDEVCRPSGECVSSLEKNNFSVFFVPINYGVGDVDFRSRVALYKTQLKLFTNLKEENFVVVDKSFVSSCDNAGAELDGFVDAWYQRRTGVSLPGLEMKNGIPVYSYRIIGVDSGNDAPSKCGCAYAVLYSPVMYVSGSECGRVEHAALHELGHTFGLCDEYDTCVWDDTNEFLSGAFGHSCLNAKPNEFNSDCSNECCSTDGVCCLGKFADVKDDGFFNVLGSSDIPPERRISSETGVLIDNFLCDNLGVCA